MNNKDKNEKNTDIYEDEIEYVHKAEIDCKYSKNGHCDDCVLPENEICPYEDEIK